MCPEFIKEEKQRLRTEMRQKRRNLLSEQMLLKSGQAANHFLSWPIYQKCATVMFYLAMPDEVQTECLIIAALNQGKRVCVPLLGEKYGEMSAAEITSLDDLLIGKYGLKMPDPAKTELISPEFIDLVIVPGVAFDRKGNRLGLGAGYYDRFLYESIHSVSVGMTYEFQIVDNLPCEEHDIKMQYLISEKGLWFCRETPNEKC